MQSLVFCSRWWEQSPIFRRLGSAGSLPARPDLVYRHRKRPGNNIFGGWWAGDSIPFCKIVTVFRSQNQARKLGQNLQKKRCKFLEILEKMLAMQRGQVRSRTQWDPLLLKLEIVTAWRSQNEARTALPKTPPQTPVPDTDNL